MLRNINTLILIGSRISYHTYDQWLKCNGMPFPHLQFMTQSVPPPHIVIMLGKDTRPLSGAQT